jgi:hypothetical protein
VTHPANARFLLAPQVVSEKYENEVLIINLDTGTYYSLTGASPRLWELLQNGESLEAILRVFVEESNEEADPIRPAVIEFIVRLLAEKLIVTDSTMDPFDPYAELIVTSDPGVEGAAPVFGLQIFTDMQDLLLLDPIHDVESEGWPVARRTDSESR